MVLCKDILLIIVERQTKNKTKQRHKHTNRLKNTQTTAQVKQTYLQKDWYTNLPMEKETDRQRDAHKKRVLYIHKQTNEVKYRWMQI